MQKTHAETVCVNAPSLSCNTWCAKGCDPHNCVCHYEHAYVSFYWAQTVF